MALSVPFDQAEMLMSSYTLPHGLLQSSPSITALSTSLVSSSPLPKQEFPLASAEVLLTDARCVRPKIQDLFEAADINKRGILDWNSGEVAAFGKSVLTACGRDAEDKAGLIYNVFADLDHACSGTLDAEKGQDFARKLLDNVTGRPASVTVPSNKSSIRRYEGPVFVNKIGELPDPVDGESTDVVITKAIAPGIIAPAVDMDRLYKLRQENTFLLEKQRQLSEQRSQFAGSDAPQLAEELSFLRREKEDLAQHVAKLEEMLATASSGAYLLADPRIPELERQNAQLLQQLQNQQEAIPGASAEDLQVKWSQTLDENSRLENMIQQYSASSPPSVDLSALEDRVNRMQEQKEALKAEADSAMEYLQTVEAKLRGREAKEEKEE